MEKFIPVVVIKELSENYRKENREETGRDKRIVKGYTVYAGRCTA